MKVLLATILGFAAAAAGYAQTDSAGKQRSAPARKPAAKPKAKKPAKKPKPAAQIPVKPTSTGPGRSTNASLTISVSEPETEIFLADSSGKNVFETPSRVSAADRSPLKVDELGAGTYKLIVRKPGYTIEARDVTLEAGKAVNAEFILQPVSAFLTVTGADGVTIEVEGVGAFVGGFTRRLIEPRSYNIRMTRKGYRTKTQTVAASLGKETVVAADLVQVPVAQLLNEAASALSSQDADRAMNAAKEVLDAEPENPRANLLMGQGAFLKSQTGAAIFLINALRGGETVTLPIRLYSRARTLQVPDGELALDQNELRLTSASRPEVNFKINRDEVRELAKRSEDPAVAYVTFKGKGDANGNKVDRTVRIYSPSAAISSGKISCSSSVENRCVRDVDNLSDVISSWQTQPR